MLSDKELPSYMRQSNFEFIGLWFFASFIMYCFNMIVMLFFLEALSDLFFTTSVNVVVIMLFILATAPTITFAQWYLCFQNIISFNRWLSANLLGGLLSLGALDMISSIAAGREAYQVIGDPENAYSGVYTLSDQWYVTVFFLSVSFGMALAFPQWWALRRWFLKAKWLFLLKIIASGVAFLIITYAQTTFNDDQYGLYCYSCCIAPFAFVMISAIGMSGIIDKKAASWMGR